MKIAADFSSISYDTAYETQVEYWADTWANSDIVIEHDPENQQGIRYCIFQLHQTYHGEDLSLNIGAKGLTGEAYNGNTFWDTETYCLPFYIFNNPRAARNLLEYRYKTLPKAIERARELDCQGAFYPIATLDGSETCALWQHASLQLQASTAVAYGIWHYEKLLNDKEFLYGKGIEMLVQISRMLASRGQWGQKTGKFGFFAVMGPDEFQMMVNNNCYTNIMGKKTFEYAIKVINEMEINAPEQLAGITEKLALKSEELECWEQMAENMFIPFDSATGIYEQHDGFFNLPHIDIHSIPVKDFPLYHSWSYDRIYRNDMIKQPDVLMFMFLYNQEFSLDAKKVNYNYYEPRCIHESSLSPSVHSILAAELGKKREAYDFFKFSTRLDLDNYNRNTAEGLHLTSIAAAWMNIVYGFGGMRSDGDVLVFNPSIPEQWKEFGFKLVYHGSVVNVRIDSKHAEFKILKGNSQTIRVYEKEYKIDEKGNIINIFRH
jgi:maltose phosphorylase